MPPPVSRFTAPRPPVVGRGRAFLSSMSRTTSTPNHVGSFSGVPCGRATHRSSAMPVDKPMSYCVNVATIDSLFVQVLLSTSKRYVLFLTLFYHIIKYKQYILTDYIRISSMQILCYNVRSTKQYI